MDRYMIILLAVMATMLLAFIVLALFIYRQNSRVNLFHRLRSYTQVNKRKNSENTKDMNIIMVISKQLGQTITSIRPMTVLDLRMEQAGIPLLGGEYLALNLMGAAVVLVVAWIFSDDFLQAFWTALLVPVFSWLGILRLIKRRQEIFINQLSDALLTIANSLRAGFSFMQAMDIISQEMEPPIGEEFGRVMRETAVGNTLESSLHGMVARMQSSDFSLVVTAVLIQREVGGNLAQILDNISNTISERIRMRREIMVLTSQGRMSAWVLLALPIVMALFMNFSIDGYMDTIISHPLGRMVLIICVVLEIIGYFIIRRIIDIDV